MHLCHHPRLARKLLKSLQEQHPRLFIQRTLRIGLHQQTPNHRQYMRQANVRLPVTLQNVHTHIPRRRHVRMKYLGQKPPLGRHVWIVRVDCQPHTERPTLVRRALRPLILGVNLHHVLLVDRHRDPGLFQVRSLKPLDIAEQVLHVRRRHRRLEVLAHVHTAAGACWWSEATGPVNLPSISRLPWPRARRTVLTCQSHTASEKTGRKTPPEPSAGRGLEERATTECLVVWMCSREQP
mmetsp:Transcript_6188/g.17117  ORF Transcript_6188/g.17117 Transcript_6188/m.17117 type:complete len:238 (-) Transcript_6188:79-792(-)